MHFERIYDEDLAASTYLIGCSVAKAAFIVDPLLSIERYLNRADELGFTITGVLETHIHADFASGGRALALAVDAPYYVSGEGPPDWRYNTDGMDAQVLSHGDSFDLGNVRFEALHTPGHTPEHMSYLVTDRARGEAPVILLSGDFTFVGDLGRPDLLEASDSSAGSSGSARELAARQYDSVVSTIMQLPGDLQVWPGHGSGSACGKALGSVPSSTVGYERKTAWWADFTGNDDEQGFAEELLTGQPETPAYFALMKKMNRDGGAEDSAMSVLPRLTPAAAAEFFEAGAIAVDLASTRDFAQKHVSGAINLPSFRKLSTHAGATLPYDARLVVLCDSHNAAGVTEKLRNIGLFNVEGWLPRESAMSMGKNSSMLSFDAHDAAGAIRNGAVALDVRSRSEFDAGHLPGAVNRQFGVLASNGADLSKDATYITYCGSGIRASIAASILKRRGYDVAAGGGYSAIASEL